MDRKLGEVEAPPPPPPSPSNFIVGCPKAAFLFWFFSGFRCGVWLLIVLLVRYNNRKYRLKKQTSDIRLAAEHLYEKLLFTWLSLVRLLVASYFVLFFFPTICLG